MIAHRERAAGVHERLQQYLDEVERRVPWEVVILYGRRTDGEQAALYAKGRTEPGPNAGHPGHGPLGDTVTNARTARDTAHGRGAAVDLCPRIDGHTPWQTGQPGHELFMARLGVLGGIALSMDLQWGGEWEHPRDYDHVQVPGWRQLPMQEVGR